MRVAILDDYQDVALDLADWKRLDAEVVRFGDTVSGRALIDRLEAFDVVCLMRERTPLPAEAIAALPRLKLIVTTGRRNAAIDIAEAGRRGITVCGTESRTAATAQMAMTLILAASRGLVREGIAMRDGGWQAGLGRDLDGLTLGVVGLGRLGAEIVSLARPFGMSFVAWSANLTDARCAEVGVARAESLEALLETADIVTIHLVLSERTRRLFGPAQLSRMKPDALLANSSRGPIVDDAALLAGLRAGRPGAAALDVYESEPLPGDHTLRDRELIDAGRLLLTPHIGYVSRQTYVTFYTQTVDAIEAWKNGRPLRVIAP
jgi:phosphoglycerate dehydrogenase-like enzyme